MSGLALWIATKLAIEKIFIATLTLAPGFVSYWVYTAIIKDQPPLSSLQRPARRKRIAKQILAGLAVAFFMAYGLAQTCPTDDAGYCEDEDWKPPTRTETLANFERLSFLILIGLSFAYKRKAED